MENLVAFTKKLLNEGYTQRQVAIITGQGQFLDTTNCGPKDLQ